ncbi:hypothetical protein BC834DRAFT_236842 [Gloeopeniophorella convolvens]|nr:hypothetical protein BC834DRAFT_236842 [Gloeopeniophorella convolvens]
MESAKKTTGHSANGRRTGSQSDEYRAEECSTQLRASHTSSSDSPAVDGWGPQGESNHTLSSESHEVAAKRRQNSLSRAAMLLPDILLLIFELHAEMYSPFRVELERSVKAPSTLSTSSRLGWLVDTHVCHQWRHVAISHPSLWTIIPFALGQRWADLSILRAKSAGLIMDYRFPPDGTPSPFNTDTLSNNLHQVLDLALAQNSREVQKVVKTLTSPAPRLETFIIEMLDFNSDSSSRNFPIVLPADFFAGQAPQLRNLRLDQTYLPWTSALLRNLKSLIISQCLGTSSDTRDGSDGDTPRTYVPESDLVPSCDQLLNILRACPDLRVLSLFGCLPNAYNSRVGHSPIFLRHIEHLNLMGVLTGIECLLQHCIFSDSCILSIHITLFDGESPRLTSALRPLLPASRRRPLNALVVSPIPSATAGLEIRVFRGISVTSFGSVTFTRPEDIDLVLHFCDRRRLRLEHFEAFDRICDLLAPENIEVIAFGAAIGGGPLSFLAHTRLKHLYVHRFLYLSIFFIGAESSGPLAGATRSALICPTLETVWLVEVDLRSAVLINLDGRITEITSAEWIETWLKRRSEAGMRLETLVLDRCVASSAHLENLRRTVSILALRATISGDPESFF